MKVVKQYSTLLSRPEEKIVYWYIGDKCNYRCSYCHPTYYGGKLGWHPFDVMKQTIDKFVENGVRKIFFSGGEPTFHPQIVEIIKHIPHNVSVVLVTNGFQSLQFWEDLLQTHPLLSASISFHQSQTKVEPVLMLATLLKSYKRSPTVEVMMSPERWDQCMQSYTQLKQLDVDVTPKLLFPIIDQQIGRVSGQIYEPHGYTQEQRDWAANETCDRPGSIIRIYSNGHQDTGKRPQALIQLKQTDFKGWKCFARSQTYLVNFNGDVWTSLCSQRYVIGNIFKNVDFPPNGSYDICDIDTCTGFLDLFSTKEAP